MWDYKHCVSGLYFWRKSKEDQTKTKVKIKGSIEISSWTLPERSGCLKFGTRGERGGARPLGSECCLVKGDLICLRPFSWLDDSLAVNKPKRSIDLRNVKLNWIFLPNGVPSKSLMMQNSIKHTHRISCFLMENQSSFKRYIEKSLYFRRTIHCVFLKENLFHSRRSLYL